MPTSRTTAPTAPRWPGWGAGRSAAFSPWERLFFIAIGVAMGLSAWLWAGAQVTARIWSGSWLDLPFAKMLPIAVHAVAQPSDPTPAFGVDAAAQLPGPAAFWTVTALLGLLPAVSVCWLVQRRLTRRRRDEPTVAHWATKRDLKPLIVKRPTPGRLTIGRGPSGRLLAAEPGHSLLVLGPTQSGKTSGLAIPAILEWPGPVVATSVKNDLLAATLDARRERGTVWTYDPTGSVTGVPHAGWSPLANCHTWSGALRTASWLSRAARAKDLQESDFWFANAAKLLAPLLFAAATAGMTMADVVRWLDLQEEAEVRLLLEAAGVAEALAAAAASWNREDRAKSSIYTTAETILSAFADPVVAASAEECDILPEQLLDGAHSLYICSPLHEQARLRPLFTALVQHVLAVAYEQAALRGRLDPPLLLVLDEAANIAPLRDLDQIASTAAGLGIQLVTIWQDRAQIMARYGQRAATVVNNHRAKLLLSGITDAGTTGDFSQVIGDTEIHRQSTTLDAEGRMSATHAEHVRPLASAAGLRQLRPFEGVLVYGRYPPTHVRLVASTTARTAARAGRTARRG